jgi:hypothetical protein
MEQPNDLLRSRTEAALLLRLDPSNLSPSDSLRCDLIASLRLVVDDASTSVLDGRAPDLARLLTATESLIRLLPSEPPKPASTRDDPRQHMWRTYLEMRRRGADVGQGYDGLVLKVKALEAEIEALKAAGAPAPDGSTGVLPPNVVPLRTTDRSVASPSPPAAPAAPPSKPFVNGLSDVPQHVRDTRPQNEAWRSFVKIDWQG